MTEQNNDLTPLREQTPHGDRVEQAPADEPKRDLVEDIIGELEDIDAGDQQKTIRVWDGHLDTFVRALESDSERLDEVGHALQCRLDVDEGDVDRSEILRFAFRLGSPEAAPSELEAVREAV